MGASQSVDSPLSSSSTSDQHDERQTLLQGHPHRSYPTAPVTELIKETRYCIINALDTYLTREELGRPEIYLSLILPIVRLYREERKDIAASYCFLLNRWQFLKDAQSDLANANLNETRAHACEIVASKVLKAFTMRQLIDVLTFDFSPVKQRGSKSKIYIPHFEGEPDTEPMSAIEVAIAGKAKHFISNPIVQEVINQIWLGNIVFFASAIDMPETCRNATQQEIRIVTIYDTSNIEFLRLSRLRVPRYKTTFQMVLFSAFILIYTAVTFNKEFDLTVVEIVMDIFAISYTVDEVLQLQEAGPSFYFGTVWNVIDMPMYLVFMVFMGLRCRAITTGSVELSNFAFDVLACNSILLWPRLCAALDHYKFFGTMLIVLRQMLIDAMMFIALSCIFYFGFLQAFYALHDNQQTYGEIAWLLLQVFFGSAFLGFEQAEELSKIFGAPLMVLFVAISVLMLYTLLISIFSQTFSEVSANAKEEFMFLFSVKVMEEVKSDALFEFLPPVNILAGVTVWIAGWVCSADKVGRLNRLLLRMFFFPELVVIWIFEQIFLKNKPQYMPSLSWKSHEISGIASGASNQHNNNNRGNNQYQRGNAGSSLQAPHQHLQADSRRGSPGGSSTGGDSFLPTTGGVAARRRAQQQQQLQQRHQQGIFSDDDQSISIAENQHLLPLSPFLSDGQQQQSPYPRPTNYASTSHAAHPLDTRPTTLVGNSGVVTGDEIVSPHFENIRRFREANRLLHRTTSGGSGQGHGQQYSHASSIISEPVNQNEPTEQSLQQQPQPMAPILPQQSQNSSPSMIDDQDLSQPVPVPDLRLGDRNEASGVGNGHDDRQTGSLGGRGVFARSRKGTDATLAHIYQGWLGLGLDSGVLSRHHHKSHMPDFTLPNQHHFHQHAQHQQLPEHAQGYGHFHAAEGHDGQEDYGNGKQQIRYTQQQQPQQHYRSQGEGSPTGLDRQVIEQEIARMVDSRFEEFRQRFEMLDEKMNALMNAVLIKNGQGGQTDRQGFDEEGGGSVGGTSML